jgi:hypothetical protein
MKSIIEARELTLKYLEPIVKKHGFTVKVNARKQARIERKVANGIDILGFDMLNYAPSFQILYAFSKINIPINDILLRFQEKVRIPLQEDKRSWFILFSYNTLHKPTETTYLPYMDTEEEVQKCVGMMSSFIEDPGLPLLSRFDDLREVDRIINDEEPWETDWHKPYVLGGNFHLKRLIIPRLAGLGNYDRVFSFVSDYYTSHFNDEQYGNNYKARMAEVVELDRLLKEVRPLY